MARGKRLDVAMRRESAGQKEWDAPIKEKLGEKADAFLKGLPSFKDEYQTWYSEALAVIRQVLPDRLDDFRRHYHKPKLRKDITFENYHIEDYLQGLQVTFRSEVVV